MEIFLIDFLLFYCISVFFTSVYYQKQEILIRKVRWFAFKWMNMLIVWYCFSFSFLSDHLNQCDISHSKDSISQDLEISWEICWITYEKNLKKTKNYRCFFFFLFHLLLYRDAVVKIQDRKIRLETKNWQNNISFNNFSQK